jgi:adenine-specific DNA-methyltransferase
MRYFGSKVSTLKVIYDLASKYAPRGSFCDPFGGIGSVGSYLQSKGYEVWSGDILCFAYYFQITRLKYAKQLAFKKVITELSLGNRNDLVVFLNSLSTTKGWFVNEYSKKRLFFTEQNAQKIQACRRKIMTWAQKGWLNHDEHAVMLASLINSMDRVANTAGTYYAYLKKWHRKALNDFRFELIEPVPSKSKGYCFHEPAKTLVRRQHFDILYLDPPYNERSYAHYYHLPETIALEATPNVHGMSGVPNKISTFSDFNKPKEAKYALIDILDNASFNYLIFHYTDDGVIRPHEVRNILSEYGSIEDHLIDSKGYTTKAKPRNVKHHLYLVHNA